MNFLNRFKRFSTLRTSKGGDLSARRSDGVVYVSNKDDGDRLSLYLYVARHQPDIGFLIPGDARPGPIIFKGASWAGRLTPFRLHRMDGTPCVRISDPFSKALVSLRSADGQAPGLEAFIASDSTFGELFTLVSAKSPPPEVEQDARALDTLLQRSPDRPGLLEDLIAADASCDTLEAFSRFLKEGDEAVLVERLLDGAPSPLIKTLRGSCNDVWAREALPDISRWLAGGRQDLPFPRTIDDGSDVLDSAGADGRTSTFSSRCAKALRQSIVPRHDLCVLTTVRNEGLYLVDWLAYHRALGIERFFVYTNDNDDGSDKLLTELSNAGFISLLFNEFGPGVRPQYKAYGHALQALPEILDYRWVAAIDLDEYVAFNPRKYDSLFDFLRRMELNKADSIALPWTWHDPQGEILWRDVPVNDRFPMFRPDHHKHVKSIFRPNRFTHSHCHFPHDDATTPRRYQGVDGSHTSASPFRSNEDSDSVWVAHHLFKSLEELVVRRCRNRGDGAISDVSGGTISTGFLDIYLNETPSYWQAAPLSQFALDPDTAAKVERQKQLILQTDAIRAADTACKAWFKPESARVRAALGREARFHVPGSVEARALELLDRMDHTKAESRADGPAVSAPTNPAKATEACT